MPIGATIATAAATVGGAVISSNAASNASNKASQAAAANNALQTSIYDQNKATLAPYVDSGTGATTELNGLLGINGADPAAAKKAFDTYQNSDGYNFVSGAGNKAIAANASVNGLLDSGGTLKALDNYNEGLASTYLGQYEGQLQGVAGNGLSAANAQAGVGTGYANAVSANNNNAANTSANAGLSTASSINGLLTNAIGAYGLTKGLSSYSAPGAAPANTNIYAATGTAAPTFGT